MSQQPGGQPIPTYADLASVYGLQGAVDAMGRYGALMDAFQARYGGLPALYARAPGRVNLIGEHIDYSGYGVLPMAIAPDTAVAIRASPGHQLEVANQADAAYPAAAFPVDPGTPVDTEHHVWANYVLAAYKGVHEYLEGHPAAATTLSRSLPGLQLMVHGTVPTASGLSSSSALVVAAAVAILAAYGVVAPAADVAAFTATCERFVGVQSGGMDQAISIMARPGEAAYVQFEPVRATPVPLPAPFAFVVADSLTVSNKAETAAGRYNLRVVECRLAAVVLAAALKCPLTQARSLRRLRDVEDVVRLYYSGEAENEQDPGGSGLRPTKAVPLPDDIRLLDRCADAAHSLLQEEPYVPAQVTELIGCPIEDLFSDFPAAPASIAYAAQHGGFALRSRAVHVYHEAARVLRWRALCAGPDGDEVTALALGGLMRKSHESCRDLFDCSAPEIEDLLAAAHRGGALGSRLTGAGWGGATVHLVRQTEVDHFIDVLKREFYLRRLSRDDAAPPEERALGAHVFASPPAHGAAVITDSNFVAPTAPA